MNEEEKRSCALKEIRDELIKSETSPLFSYRNENKYFPVVGQGSHFSKIMFIGEAPGKNEAEKGRPFCGMAGKILDEFLASINLPREEVYITNIVKDRPPGNRDPLPSEIEFYSPYLDRQIEIIKPKIIATLGRFSMDYIMRKFGLESQIKVISKIHGNVFETDKDIDGEKLKIIPLYHPAVAIYNRNEKENLIKDFQILKYYL